MSESKYCPNGHGYLIELKKPAFIAPTEDTLEYINDMPDDKKFFMKLLRICQTCGYYEVEEVSLKEFERS